MGKLSLFSLLVIGGGLSIRQIGTTRFFLFFHYESAYSTIRVHLITYTSVGTRDTFLCQIFKTSFFMGEVDKIVDMDMILTQPHK